MFISSEHFIPGSPSLIRLESNQFATLQFAFAPMGCVQCNPPTDTMPTVSVERRPFEVATHTYILSNYYARAWARVSGCLRAWCDPTGERACVCGRQQQTEPT